jgi:NitT/TauT family transport system permease protein
MNTGAISRGQSAIAPLAAAIVGILVWEFGAKVLRIPEYLLPAPSRVAMALSQHASYLLYHGIATLAEASLGFVVALVAGMLSGVLFALFRPLERALLPLAVASQAIPIVAVAPILIVWLGNGMGSKVVMASLLCFFPMLINSTRGLQSVTADQLALFVSLGASRKDVLLKLQLPASVSFIVAGMRISGALAMIGAIVAEYAGAERGLGYVLIQATYRLDTSLLFAAVLCSAVGGWVIYGITRAAEVSFFSRYLHTFDGRRA